MDGATHQKRLTLQLNWLKICPVAVHKKEFLPFFTKNLPSPEQ
jgi:hypothetical protein